MYVSDSFPLAKASIFMKHLQYRDSYRPRQIIMSGAAQIYIKLIPALTCLPSKYTTSHMLVEIFF